MTAIDTKRLRELAENQRADRCELDSETVIQLLDEIDRQNELLAVAKAALEFYADEKKDFLEPQHVQVAVFVNDLGHKARDALKRLGEV